MQVASQILKDKEHDSYITNCQLVSLLSSFCTRMLDFNTGGSVNKIQEDTLEYTFCVTKIRVFLVLLSLKDETPPRILKAS